jgi:hypothetical protein
MDLEEAAPPPFTRNLPPNVSKIQDLRPQNTRFLLFWGVPRPFLEHPLFEISGSATIKNVSLSSGEDFFSVFLLFCNYLPLKSGLPFI